MRQGCCGLSRLLNHQPAPCRYFIQKPSDILESKLAVPKEVYPTVSISANANGSNKPRKRQAHIIYPKEESKQEITRRGTCHLASTEYQIDALNSSHYDYPNAVVTLLRNLAEPCASSTRSSLRSLPNQAESIQRR